MDHLDFLNDTNLSFSQCCESGMIYSGSRSSSEFSESPTVHKVQNRIHKEITVLLMCSFILAGSGTIIPDPDPGKSFRIHADPDPQH